MTGELFWLIFLAVGMGIWIKLFQEYGIIAGIFMVLAYLIIKNNQSKQKKELEEKEKKLTKINDT